MVESPGAFQQVHDELFPADTTKLRQAKLRETPKAFDAVDVVFTSGEFVLMVMDPVVAVSFGDQTVIGFPAICVDGRIGQDLPFDDWHKLLARAVLHHLNMDFAAAFEKPDDRSFSRGTPPPFAAHSFGAKVTFVHFDLAGERSGFLACEGDDKQPQKGV